MKTWHWVSVFLFFSFSSQDFCFMIYTRRAYSLDALGRCFYLGIDEVSSSILQMRFGCEDRFGDSSFSVVGYQDLE